MEKLCTLSGVIGNVEECPRGWCAFWDRSGCAIEQMGIDLTNVDLSYHLLELRKALEAVRSAEEAERAREAFGQIRPPGL
jgi:hypothetical protein